MSAFYFVADRIHSELNLFQLDAASDGRWRKFDRRCKLVFYGARLYHVKLSLSLAELIARHFNFQELSWLSALRAATCLKNFMCRKFPSETGTGSFLMEQTRTTNQTESNISCMKFKLISSLNFHPNVIWKLLHCCSTLKVSGWCTSALVESYSEASTLQNYCSFVERIMSDECERCFGRQTARLEWLSGWTELCQDMEFSCGEVVGKDFLTRVIIEVLQFVQIF